MKRTSRFFLIILFANMSCSNSSIPISYPINSKDFRFESLFFQKMSFVRVGSNSILSDEAIKFVERLNPDSFVLDVRKNGLKVHSRTRV